MKKFLAILTLAVTVAHAAAIASGLVVLVVIHAAGNPYDPGLSGGFKQEKYFLPVNLMIGEGNRPPSRLIGCPECSPCRVPRFLWLDITTLCSGDERGQKNRLTRRLAVRTLRKGKKGHFHQT